MKAWQILRRRWTALFRQGALDADMDEEMRVHVALRTQANIESGMSPEEARLAALKQFGWTDSIKDTCRDGRGISWAENLAQDLRFAVRTLRKSPGFTAIAVLTLALGIGINTALFSVVNGVLLRPLPFPGQDRIVTLWGSDPAIGVAQQRIAPPTLADWKTQSQTLQDIAFWTGPFDYNYLTQDSMAKVRASYGSASLFPALGVSPQLGRGFVPEEDVPQGPQVAAISDRFWREHFGGAADVLGRSFTVDTFGRRTYTVVGVMPPRFQFPDDTQIWLAAGWNGLPQNRRTGHWLNVLARLKPGVTLAQTQAELNTIQSRVAQEYKEAKLVREVSAVPLLEQTVGKSLRTALLVLWGVVVAILLIASANVANLMLARATTRRKEIAVRLALGAGRSRIIRQLLAESLFLASLGAAAGILLGFWGLKILIAASPDTMPRLGEVSLDATVLGFTLLSALATGILFGLAPAWQCSRPDLQETLKDSGRAASAGGAAGKTRNLLVVAEIALATVLLVGACLMLRSFGKLLAADRGFQAEQVLTAELDFSVSGFTTWVRPTETRPQIRLRELMDRVEALPGVRAVGAASGFLRQDAYPPLATFTVYERREETGQPLLGADQKAISPNYTRALGMRLLQGRDFTEADRLDAPGVALVNESFARRYFRDENPLGKHLTMGRSNGPLATNDVHGVALWYEIVGVVNDVKSLTTQPESAPEVYRPYWQWPMQAPTLFIRVSGDPHRLMEAIRRETHAAIPNIPPPRIRLLEDRVGESVAQPRFQASLLNLFGGVALLLAGCGIYGVLAYSVAQRRHEFGIRAALGAQRRNVQTLVISQGLRLVGWGIAAGATGSIALARVVRNLLYDVTPLDPVTFAVVPAVLLAVALIACWLPARRAARVQPLEALHHD